MWDAFHYCEVFPGRFDPQECDRVIALHQEQAAQRSVMPQGDGGFISDSDLLKPAIHFPRA